MPMPLPLPRPWMAAALVGAALAATAPARAAATLAFAPDGQVWLTGDSTLHAYRSTARQVRVSVGGATRSATGVALTRLEVEIPVKGLKSGEGALDDNMYRALDAERFPVIRFVAPAGTLRLVRPGVVEAAVEGRLTVAGATRPTTVKASGTLSGDTLTLTGAETLAMSRFGVKPPVLLGGMITCRDAVTVHFELVGRLGE